MVDDYELRVLRAPDGKFIVTDNPDVQFQGGCMAIDAVQPADPIFIHLEVFHNGKRFMVWLCESRDLLGNKDVEKHITKDRREEIIAALKRQQIQPRKQ